MKEVVVFGAAGQVGRELLRLPLPVGWVVRGFTHQDVDITSERDIERALTVCPNAIAVVNAAAYTAVDEAERRRDAAFAANARAPGLIARACTVRDLPLFHLSTDYVFDGSKTDGAYAEDEPVQPLNVYGQSKLAGERAVRAAGGRHVILRTAWVYSPFGRNFLTTMLHPGREWPERAVIDDQRGCPTAAADVAKALLAMVGAIDQGKVDGFGTFHFCGRNDASWYEFACAIFEEGARFGLAAPVIRPITTAQYPTLAARPARSVLDCSRIGRVYDLAAPPWRDSLRACVAELTGRTMEHAA
ncbi:dTDP-4-dehydrorhamnose reductase [Arenibaculum sp.]|uniref:dTDP-4-dehydrorhamnose reductase n=1 Tax=Arenibaculum sp. TaxID=2865862 RepID=UPI002E0ED2B3|nr:dTDP-4-dehydrorhamnose reductase [Arenibaculum sp.]